MKISLLFFLFPAFCFAEEHLIPFSTYFKGSSLGKVSTEESEHFRVTWVHPRDEVIAAPLLKHLEAARKDLMPVFEEPGHTKTQKAPVEIFPDLKSFSDVSKLSMARFKATGTIALTLDQRLMVLSPRNLSMGYPWAITVVHEFIHYLIREISMDFIPIWLHEGVAQYYQGYPYQHRVNLSPSQYGLLKKAKAKHELLSLETLQEPFPYRKNPEEAELAYIEALVFTKYLDEKCGALRLIRMTAELHSVEAGLSKCVDMPYANLSKHFLADVIEKFPIPLRKDVVFFARDFSGSDPLEVEGRNQDRQARNFSQLSTELFKQGFFRPSAIEMEKAMKISPAAPPSWRRQLALAYQKSGQDARAIAALQDLVQDYPEDAGGWYLLGAEHQSKPPEAWNDFLKSFFVNPFLDGLQEAMDYLKQKNSQFGYSFLKPLPEK